MKKISVVVPMFNEEEVAQECYRRISNVMNSIENYDYEIIFINDGSRDDTLKILKSISICDEKVKIVSFSRNFGHESANKCGIKYATGDAIVLIDADLQDPPELIPEMLKKWEEGFVVVYGKRKSREGESAFKLITAKAFYRILNGLSEIELPVDAGDFRIIDRKIADIINNMSEGNEYLRGMIAWCGGKQYAYEYDRKKRIAGKTKYSLTKMIRLAKNGLFGFSKKPLKLVGKLGAFSILVSIGILIYSLYSYFNGKAIEPGWTSIMVTITFFTGIQLFCLSMIAEYIARIYDNSKKRPEYIIEETVNLF